jgi:hypothetical protein
MAILAMPSDLLLLISRWLDEVSFAMWRICCRRIRVLLHKKRVRNGPYRTGMWPLIDYGYLSLAKWLLPRQGMLSYQELLWACASDALEFVQWLNVPATRQGIRIVNALSYRDTDYWYPRSVQMLAACVGKAWRVLAWFLSEMLAEAYVEHIPGCRRVITWDTDYWKGKSLPLSLISIRYTPTTTQWMRTSSASRHSRSNSRKPSG